MIKKMNIISSNPVLWEIISFKTEDGIELFGGLTGSKGSDTAIIYIHGMTDNFYEGEKVKALEKLAKKQKKGFLSFNNRGAGLITLIGNGFYGTCMEKFEECLYDIDAAIKFLKQKNYKKFILIGHSTGCQKITYYQSKRKRKDIKALILMAPADDIGFQKKILGKKYEESVKHAGKMIQKGYGDHPVPEKYKTPMFSAKRYYDLYSEKSIEAHIFNYAEPLNEVEKLTIPILAIFGAQEQYAAIPPKKMLEMIARHARNKKSKTVLIAEAEHSFHGKEKDLVQAVKFFLTTL